MTAPAIPYALCISSRARHIRLRVSVTSGLEVVVPRGCQPAGVDRLIERERPWIERALARAERLRRMYPGPHDGAAPEQIALPAIGRTWRVELQPYEARGVVVCEADDVLRLMGCVAQPAARRAALRRWLQRQAARHLPPMLEEVSRVTGLTPVRVGIRQQRSRWGSCSARGTVNLNARLLLLDRETARYVLIHELCHLRQMNHSRAFWALVAAFCPDHRRLDAHLRHAWKHLPGWV